MKSKLRVSTFREIKSTFGRFAAILAIIALGVGFFSGVKITTPAMVNTVGGFMTDHELFDYRIISTLGWEEEDVEALRGRKDVRGAEGAYALDLVLNDEAGNELVFKTHSLTEGINVPELLEGRLPENENECLVDGKTKYKVGDRFTVSPENPEDTLEDFTPREVTVVGRIYSPAYVHFERGTTTLGSGAVNGYIYLDRAAFDMEVYTELYVKLDHELDVYSDEYKDYMSDREDGWEKAAEEQAEDRYDRIVSDAEYELAEGRQELEDARAEGQQKLDDARAELDDARAELDEAAEKLTDAEKDIADGEKEISDNEKKLADAKKTLDDTAGTLASGKTQLDNAAAQLAASKKQLDQSAAQLTEGENALAAAQAEIDAGAEQLAAGQAEIDAQTSALNEQYAAFMTEYGQYLGMLDMLPEEQAAAVTAGKAQLDAGFEQLEAARTELESKKTELAAGQAELDKQRTALAEGRAQYEAGKARYDAGYAQYAASLAQYNSGKSRYDSGRAEYEDGVKQLEDGKAELEKGKKEYEDGKAEYEEGLKKYEDGEEEYQDGVTSFDEEIAKAEQELADGEQELRDLKKPDVFLLDRNTNIGYACFENDSEIVEQVARVFPIFFILVAALVCMTTMSRMVEERRTQIGTLKALGYSERAIMSKFTVYAGTAAVLGCVLGYGVGTVLFPKVIWMTYKLMYIELDIDYLFDWKLASIAGAVAIICSVGAAWLSCRYELSETAAGLMRPKAPKAGKRVLLERIPFIWDKMKFLHKVSIRNIFRYKKRFFMMIVGISGCTALLLTGFGMKDSVSGFAEVQYEEVVTADASLVYSPDENGDMPAEIRDKLEDMGAEYACVYSGAWDLVKKDLTKSISLMAPEDFSQLRGKMNFMDTEGSPLDPPEGDEALVSISIAERYDVKEGDEITLRDENMRVMKFTVKKIFDNHVYNYIFVPYEAVARQLGGDCDLNDAYVKFRAGEDVYKAQTVLGKLEGVTNMTLYQDLKKRLTDSMSSLDYVVLLVILSAAGLAFIVLYNLTNINITEREREIATIKVLGFFKKETAAYVLRENIALTALGIAVGLGLGRLLHKFVMAQIVVDMVSFKERILPMSYIYSIGLTFVFNLLVNLVMENKLEKINMAESLKSVE
ncbi:FtsX-like permease family protein [Ruminococcus sp.]|uniref:FtsX-like permease family protein n=1 Tax=Ruminococcus sp. TaxID=41978 RepID=UPI0025E5E148|nr:FtsX-like permease family protein [Ruminococcus sp.]MBQ8966159.1 FtsX-like permease family protein [Ruminococcus sp.]